MISITVAHDREKPKLGLADFIRHEGLRSGRNIMNGPAAVRRGGHRHKAEDFGGDRGMSEVCARNLGSYRSQDID